MADKPAPKLYTLQLTADEVYYLDQGYSASFLELDQQNKDEKSVSKKLLDLTLKVHKDKKNGR